MPKKNIVLIILGFALILTLVSCSKKPESIPDTPTDNSPVISSQESRVESAGKAEAEAKPLRTEDNKVSITSIQANPLDEVTSQRSVGLYEAGLKLYYERNFKEALDLFNQALDINPQNYQALNGKGATFAFQGRYSEGISLIQKAIQINPEFVYAHFNLGLAHELAGDYNQSIEAYKAALRLDEKDVWSYYGIASIYGRKGEVEKVIEWLRPAIALESEVKAVAREEKDFNPVKSDPLFQSLIKP